SLSNWLRAVASTWAVSRSVATRRSRSASVAVSGSKLAIASAIRLPRAPKCLLTRRAVRPHPLALLIAVPFVGKSAASASLSLPFLLDCDAFRFHRDADHEVDVDAAPAGVAVHAVDDFGRDQEILAFAAGKLAHVGHVIQLLAQAV